MTRFYFKVAELLIENQKLLGKFPKRLIFLRDGVSEGQFKQVKRTHLIKDLITYFISL
jgi:hypothetical protein